MIESDKWVVIYTKPNFEKKIGKELSFIGVEYYLPYQRVRKQWKDRKKWVEELLFRSYLFIKEADFILHKERIVHIPGYLKTIFHNGKTVLVENVEIDRIKKMCESGRKIEVSSEKPVDGDELTVTDSIFAGVKGVVVTRNRKQYLYISSLNSYLILPAIEN